MSSETLPWFSEGHPRPHFYYADHGVQRAFSGFGAKEIVKIDEPIPIQEIEKLLRTFTKSHELVFASIRFDTESEIKNEWKSFGSAFFVAPEESRLENVSTIATLKAEKNDSITWEREFKAPTQEWRTIFEQASRAFSEKQLQKVILASRDEVPRFDEIWPSVIDAPSPFSFAFSPDEKHTFFGASPELLYRRERDKILCDALAGTRLRSGDQEIDSQTIGELLSSKKDHDEHRLVIDFIETRLKEICKNIYVSETKVKTLPHLFHLHTLVSGDLITPDSILAHLHPTPALCGAPQHEAMRFLRKNETFDRGHYGGAIGVVTPEFESFAVGIRSILQTPENAFVYFGAGVIPSSTCEDEWKEIHGKKEAILANLRSKKEEEFEEK